MGRDEKPRVHTPFGLAFLVEPLVRVSGQVAQACQERRLDPGVDAVGRRKE